MQFFFTSAVVLFGLNPIQLFSAAEAVPTGNVLYPVVRVQLQRHPQGKGTFPYLEDGAALWLQQHWKVGWDWVLSLQTCTLISANKSH